ncbi:MAG: xanthine dehydrogenase family protein subunit M [Caldilineaceae bacterium SB0662_bin_9]|uniref:Xanthine dehydrogenase family protein subunit M n=1 Tax=Caldilineaceae bacterium SB0662_bin_9 TaxID=2605258 RepID=A0A6B1DVN2_9CHLR|nr:xanthine dehydrogenase family protein subunit M [Caldilineaceae bacterium SB0662_bin_9]
MHAFDYAAPTSLNEAVAVLASQNGNASILSGGTDLLAAMKDGKGDPSVVVDVKKIDELNILDLDDSGLTIGAAVPCHILNSSELVRDNYPALHDSSSLIGGTQIQGRATFGGNLCNASPAADAIPNLIAHKAVANIFGPDGNRSVPVEDFCTGPGSTVLDAGELLVSLSLPTPPAGFGAGYLRFIPRNEMDIAVVGAGVSVILDGDTVVEGRVSLGAVAPTPLFVQECSDAMAGQALSEALITEVGRLAEQAARPISDMRGTVAQRKHLSNVLTRRAMQIAVDRARS